MEGVVVLWLGCQIDYYRPLLFGTRFAEPDMLLAPRTDRT